jgi:hypothetical protein
MVLIPDREIDTLGWLAGGTSSKEWSSMVYIRERKRKLTLRGASRSGCIEGAAFGCTDGAALCRRLSPDCCAHRSAGAVPPGHAHPPVSPRPHWPAAGLMRATPGDKPRPRARVTDAELAAGGRRRRRPRRRAT